MEIAVVAEVPVRNPEGDRQGITRPVGLTSQALLSQEAPDGLNFRMVRSQFFGGAKAYSTPRHHHAFQQIRFAESGNLNYAPDRHIPQGSIAYFPRGAWYGPQMKDNGVSLAIQWGFEGEHQHGTEWDKYRAEALARLKARGTFEQGFYTEADPATGEPERKDGVQALYEEQYETRTGQKFVIPDEGYDAPILMHPAAFQYFAVAPEVAMKNLGCFFDHPGPNGDVSISMVRLSDGGSYELGPERAQLAWSLQAGLDTAGTVHPGFTCLYSGREESQTLSSRTVVEVFVVTLPRLD